METPVNFGPGSRVADVLDNPRARHVVDAALPGLTYHPALDMIRTHPLESVVAHHPAVAAAPTVAANLWSALAEITMTSRNRGGDVASEPRPDYEGHDVADASATASFPALATRWSTVEVVLDGPSHGNPFTELEVTARFTHDSAAITAGGFYDGDGRWIIRFLPEVVGCWTFTTSSNALSLNGVSGAFDVGEAAPGDHGPVRTDGFHFAHADGTRHTPLGTTAYAWIHQPAELRAATLRTLQRSPFTKVRMCVFPKAYLHNTNEPDLYPFAGSPEEGFDFAFLDPEFFRHLESAVADLGRVGIQADVILFHPYDRWGFADMGSAADDRYASYVVRRLSAYPNVWWSLANEYDLVDSKAQADWERIAAVLVDNDPAEHLRSIHNFGEPYDHGRSWVTHASMQGPDIYKTAEHIDAWRRQWGKPVVLDECGYEGNLEYAWGNLSGEELTRRCWEGAVRGGYVGHGETYHRDDEQVWWAKGGELVGDAPARIAFLRKVIEDAPGGCWTRCPLPWASPTPDRPTPTTCTTSA
ncbi:DUF5060 domain-containing protein [Streptodolium elevatio]